MDQKLKIAIAGLGGRGKSLLRHAILPAGEAYNLEVVAVYDHYEDRTREGVEIVREVTGKTPVATTSYQQILDDPQIQAVIVTAAWEAHVDQAIGAMKAGKHVAIEVGGAYCLEDCWNLVKTHEETGMHCMMLENCCYGKYELMALNMVRQGLFGEIVHCEGGYHHDLRDEISNGKEKRHYRLRNYMNRNCENYPTHELGPIAKLLDINNGNRLVSLTTTASCAKGLHAYVERERGPEHPLSKVEFAQGDVITTVIKCAKGQTIVLTLDTTLPRAYSRGFTVRGTKGAYFEDTKMVFLDGEHNEFDFDASKIWGNAEKYAQEYAHPLWKDYDPKGGHGGMDYLVVSAFLEAISQGKRPPIDTYDTATYMSITPLSEESILRGSAPVMIPDFTRGKWYNRTDIEPLQYNLDCEDYFGEYYQNK